MRISYRKMDKSRGGAVAPMSFKRDMYSVFPMTRSISGLRKISLKFAMPTQGLLKMPAPSE